MLIPPTFRSLIAGRAVDGQAARPTDGDTWLTRLPRLVEEHLERWGLVLDGEARHGENALVLPVRLEGPSIHPVGSGSRGLGRSTHGALGTRDRLALEFTWPHVEADLEHLALRQWDGRGAVRLIAANPSADALLLERLDAERPLTAVSILEACEEIGVLVTLLDRPASPQFQTVADKAQRWRAQLRDASGVPRRLAEQALATLDDLLAAAPPSRLVHEDLHDHNVLAPLDPARGRWLAIDPKPVAGELAHAVAPIVWNRADAAARAHNLRAHVRLRADVVADAAGLDLDRVYAWTLVRLVLNATWAAEFSPSSDDFRGRMIALAKAFADPPD